VLGHAGGAARGQSGPGGPGLADSRPRRVMETCKKLDHRGVKPTHTEPQPDTAVGHDTRETQPPTLPVRRERLAAETPARLIYSKYVLAVISKACFCKVRFVYGILNTVFFTRFRTYGLMVSNTRIVAG